MAKRLSLKIIGIVFLLSLFVFTSLSYYQIKNYREDLQVSFIERAKSVALSMDASIENKEILQDNQKIVAIMQKHLWLDPDIMDIKINIFNDDGSVTTLSKYGSASIHEVPPETILNKDEVTSEIIDQETVLIVHTPIHISGVIGGTFEIDFALDSLNEKISSSIKTQVIAYISMMILFIVVMLILLNFIIIHPISEIKKGMNEITQANLKYDVKITSKDEFGDLKQSYDEMKEYIAAMIRSRKENSADISKQLKNAQKLKNKIKSLEKKVKGK